MSGTGSTFTLEGVSFELGLPGAHHIHDAVCAVAVTRGIGVSLIDAARALAVFQGVARRFESLGSADGVEIIDDYAHNPAKIAASVTAAHLRAKRVIAVFQPHGFGPTRFMRDELIERLDAVLGPTDAAVFLPIYFAGGTVTRDIESDDLAKDLVRRGRDARVVGRDALPAHLCRVASAGDVILVMGARDPRLGELARAVRAALHDRAADSGRDRAETANEGPA